MTEARAAASRVVRRAMRGAVAGMLVAGSGGLFVLGSRPAAAIDNSTWEVVPTHPRSASGPGHDYLVYALSPGQVVHDSVSVHNLTHEPLTFRTYASDATNSPRDGAFALGTEDAAKVDVATWVLVEPGPVVVPGGGRIDVPFVLSVPLDATPGDHSGGIVTADVGETSQVRNGGAVITVVRALGVRIYARVAGPLHPALSTSPVKIKTSLPLLPHLTGEGRATVSFEVRNTGNIRQAPTLRVRFTDIFGRTLARLPTRQLPDLLPGGHFTVRETWVGVPSLGRFTAHVDLATADVRVSRQRQLWAVPWIELAAAVALAASAVVLWRWLRGRARRARLSELGKPLEGPQSALAQSGSSAHDMPS